MDKAFPRSQRKSETEQTQGPRSSFLLPCDCKRCVVDESQGLWSFKSVVGSTQICHSDLGKITCLGC